MTLTGWEGVPTFGNGQVMSAAHHLNYLARGARFLQGEALGAQMPFTARGGYRAWDSYATMAKYALRHHSNSLRWKYEIAPVGGDTGYAKLVVDGVDVPATANTNVGGGAVSYEGTADLTTLGLTLGAFYVVELQLGTVSDDPGGAGTVTMLELWETTTASYPTLITFADGVTPTAAQWQALSTYATTLHDTLDVTQAPMTGGPRVACSDLVTIWRGTMRHQCDGLMLSIALATAHEDGDYTVAHVYINGNEIVELKVDHDDAQTVDGAAYTVVDPGEPNYTPLCPARFFLTVDISGEGLARGEVYELTVTASAVDEGAEQPYAVVHYLLEVPLGTETIAGYTDPATWAHGDYVRGNSNSPQVEALATDLEALGTAVPTSAYQGSPWRDPDVADVWHWGIRRRRYLHYTNLADRNPSVRWLHGDWQEATLEPADDETDWKVVDLDAFEGLWPGVRYQVNKASFAVEDGGL